MEDYLYVHLWGHDSQSLQSGLPEASMMPSEERVPLQNPQAKSEDDLATLRWCLRYLVADFRGMWAWFSWIIFFVMTFAIPTITGIVKYRSSLLGLHDFSVQVALTFGGSSSFWSIRSLLHRHGLDQAMFLEELRNESVKVQQLLVSQLRAKYRLFYAFVGVCTILGFCYRAYWFFIILPNADHGWLVLGGAEFLSFVYRVAIIFVSSLLLQIHCVLQVLRMEDFVEAFADQVELMTIYDCQKSLEKHLNAISASHQFFIASLLVTGTTTQLCSILIFTEPCYKINLATGSELILCVGCLFLGLMMCLTGAIKITHEAQSIKRHAASWHARISMSTADPSTSYYVSKEELRMRKKADSKFLETSAAKDNETKNLLPDDELLQELRIDTRMKFLAGTMAYEKRIAILTFLEGYKGGISLYGFVLDRNWVQALCMMQLSLVMWVLSKTMKL